MAIQKTVVVFGAYGGVGSAVSRWNYVRGAQVVLVGRDEQKLLKLKEGYDSKNAMIIVGDANNRDDVKKVLKITLETFNEIDEIWITVGKDGGWEQDYPNSPEEKKIELYQKLYPSLLKPIETIVPLVEEVFKKQGHGILVHLSSHAAFKTEGELPGNYTYRLLKQKAENIVNEMTKRLKSHQNKARGVNLQPAIIFTPGTAKLLNTKKKQDGAVKPEDLAEWVHKNANSPHLPEDYYFPSKVVV